MQERQAYWRHLIVPGLLVGVLLVVLALGRGGLIGDMAAIGDAAGQLGDSRYGIPLLIGMFCVGAYFGIPQFLLIAGAVVSFGPWAGFGLSWLATMCSGTLTFLTGRVLGEGAVRRFGGARLNRVSTFLGANAFFASALVRTVPAGPFVLVNMTFGASRARYLAFVGGMALGSLPKIALVAFAGKSLMAAMAGSMPLAFGMALAFVLLWLGLGWVSRRVAAARGRQNVPKER